MPLLGALYGVTVDLGTRYEEVVSASDDEDIAVIGEVPAEQP
ncbi:MAG: hypothetical protein ACRDJ2_13440 [Actinomycetota bacterium]